VDMSGGSSDDACLSIAHAAGKVAVVDLVMKQAGGVPFNPRMAVERFAATLKEYGIASVTGDQYAGQTFKADFEAHSIAYRSAGRAKSDLYEALEPALNAGEVELPDIPVLQEQLLCLVMRGARVDHEPNGHDDWANAAAGAVHLVRDGMTSSVVIATPIYYSRGNTFPGAVSGSTRNPAHAIPYGPGADAPFISD